MQKIGVLVLLLMVSTFLSAMVVETASFDNFIYGSEPACQYDNWISHLAEKVAIPGYNVYAPWDRQTAGFGNFHIPTTTELTEWGAIIEEFRAQNWENVDNLLGFSVFPYQLVEFHDTDTDRTYYMLREIPDTTVDDNGTQDPYDDEQGAFTWGWGLYVFNPAATRRIIITVPHPCDDFPAPVLATYAFKTWNAEFLMIAGAGREVAWTQVGSFTNSKSLSDPTRTTNHPFYPAYTKFCDKIRTDTGKREFSAQIHTYDSTLHLGFANVQISAGYNRTCPNLPIRDLSRFKNDLINHSDYLMIPANTIGSNNDVYINDYYTVQCEVYPFTYNHNGEQIPVNNYMDLPAYSQNVLMNYTINDWTDYDTYEPFFHAEMDELPNCYVQNNANYYWFYNWNIRTQHWNMGHLFDHTLQYYSIWINNMNAVLDDALNPNDGSAPLPPTNLTVFNQAYDYITLQWQKADDFDFDSYEILYSNSPIDSIGYNIYSRTNDSSLASPYCQQVNVYGLTVGHQYYFKIRARDKNGNYSELSNEVNAYTAPVRISNLRAIGKDGRVQLKWNVINQQNNQGFRIYKMTAGGNFQMQAGFETDNSLAGGASSYTWNDDSVVNGEAYSYKIASVNANNVEFFNNVVVTGYPRDYYTLYLTSQNTNLTDSLSFSANPNATTGNDADYDIIKASAPSTNYVYAAFWEQYWSTNGIYCQQDVIDDFDPHSVIRSWAIRIKTDQLNTPLALSVDPSFTRYSERLFLRDSSTGTMTDLAQGPYVFQVSNTNYKSFVLYWGNLQPIPSISSLPNRVFQGNSGQTFYWSSTYSFLVDHYNLSVQNDTDSILVAENLPNSTTTYSFTFPDGITMHNCKLVLDTWSYDGQLIRTYSNFIFGIAPSSTVYAVEPGLNMQANTLPGSSLTVTQVFGENAQGWTIDTNGDWWNIPPFNFGLGYWIQKPDAFQFSTSLPIQRDSISFSLRTGWNIIPNPHMCQYRVKDLCFRISPTLYSFAEMLDQELISRGVYVYRDSAYILSDIIYPQESFLIKYYGDTTLQASIVFIPYNSGTNIQPPDPLWALKLTAGQNESDNDELIIGSYRNSLDDYDFRYDLPEPPIKPIENLTRLYLYKSPSDVNFIDHELNTEYRSIMPAEEQAEQIYDFRLEAGTTEPVNFTVDRSLFPDNYGASVHIGDFAYDIQHGNTFTFVPSHTGTFAGQIIIHNYFTGVENQTALPPVTSVSVYPNPCRSTATIAFSLNRKSPVSIDVYNIKGQHVRSLQKGQLSKGVQQIKWDSKTEAGQNAASGVYIVRIKAAGMEKTVKLMLLK